MRNCQSPAKSLLLLCVAFVTSPSLLVQALPASATKLQVDKTFLKRDEPSAYPWPDKDDPLIENEFKWLGRDVNNEEDKRDGRRIHQAFREWHKMAVSGGKSAEVYQKEGPDRDRFKRWFGEQEFPEEAGETFKLMINLATEKATVEIASMVNVRQDFHEDEKQRCAARPRINAYTIPATGDFHFCKRGIDQSLNSELESKCDEFGAFVSSKMRSVSMTFLHEATHYDQVDGTNEQIMDFIGGSTASGTFQLDDEDKIRNAQNYAWFAACGRTFSDPPPGTAEVPEDESDMLPPPPPAPSQPTKAISIIADVGYKFMLNHDLGVVDWKFFATDYRKPVGAQIDATLQDRKTLNIDKQVFPEGTFDMELFGEACQYRNDGTNTGKLFCGAKVIDCKNDPAYEDRPFRGYPEDLGRKSTWVLGNIRQPVYACAW